MARPGYIDVDTDQVLQLIFTSIVLGVMTAAVSVSLSALRPQLSPLFPTQTVAWFTASLIVVVGLLSSLDLAVAKTHVKRVYFATPEERAGWRLRFALRIICFIVAGLHFYVAFCYTLDVLSRFQFIWNEQTANFLKIVVLTLRAAANPYYLSIGTIGALLWLLIAEDRPQAQKQRGAAFALLLMSILMPLALTLSLSFVKVVMQQAMADDGQRHISVVFDQRTADHLDLAIGADVMVDGKVVGRVVQRHTRSESDGFCSLYDLALDTDFFDASRVLGPTAYAVVRKSGAFNFGKSFIEIVPSKSEQGYPDTKPVTPYQAIVIGGVPTPSIAELDLLKKVEIAVDDTNRAIGKVDRFVDQASSDLHTLVDGVETSRKKLEEQFEELLYHIKFRMEELLRMIEKGVFNRNAKP